MTKTPRDYYATAGKYPVGNSEIAGKVFPTFPSTIFRNTFRAAVTAEFSCRDFKKKCGADCYGSGFESLVAKNVASPRGGDSPRRGGRGVAGGVVAVRGRRPRMRAHSPGMHARFPFFVLSIVSRLVRAPAVKSAGRVVCVHGRPAQLVGWSVVDRARCRPADVGRGARVVRYCAAVHARAPAGCSPASPRGRMRPLSVCKSMGMPAPARGRQRPRVSPRDHVHERRPAQLGRRRDACTTSTRYPWKSAA